MREISRYLLGLLFFLIIVELVLVLPTELNERKNKKSLVKTDSHHQSTDSTGSVDEVEQVEEAIDADQVGQSMDGVHVIESKNEHKEWELWASSAMGMKSEKNMLLNKIKANFFSANGVQFQVVGAKGSVHPKRKNMKVEGQVTTTSSNGYIFKTSELNYHSKKRVLTSPHSVEVQGPKDSSGKSIFLSGMQMEADLNQGVMSIINNVKALKYLENNRKMKITSHKVELSGETRAVRFSGNVQIDVDGVKISGPDAVFNHNSQTKQLESIDLSGGVKVSDYAKWATSEKLRINLVKNEFIFDGQPRVVQDNDEVRGDRIVFLKGGKVVKVHKAKIKVSSESLEKDRNGGQR